MFKKTKQLKNSVGVILAGVFVVFIIGVNVTSSQSVKLDKSEILSAGSSVLAGPVALRSNQNLYTEIDYNLSSFAVDCYLSEPIALLPAMFSKLKPLFVNIFQRNTFYTFIRINAP
jgi:hypothetical protein